jgi:hypothetical protein
MSDFLEPDLQLTGRAVGPSIVSLGFDSIPPLPGDGDNDVIQVLVPGAGAAISGIYRTDEGCERRAFVREPMVAVIPPGRCWRMQCALPCDTLALRIAPRFYAQQVRAALGQSKPLVARYAAFDPFIREIAKGLLAELQDDHPPNSAYLEPLAGVVRPRPRRARAAACRNTGSSGCRTSSRSTSPK